MNTRVQIPQKPAAAASHFTRAPFRTPQPKCASDGSAGAQGEYAEGKKKEITLQRRAVNDDSLGTVPPIVYDVLRPPGQPLDEGTRAFFEPRFGHDFSRVHVHVDPQAAESAQGGSPFPSPSPRFREEIPLPLFNIQEGSTSPWLDETVASLDRGRPLPLSLRERLGDMPPLFLDQIRIHDDPHSRATADLLNAQAFAYKKHIVLGNRGADANWLTAHELAHVLQQTSPTTAEQTAAGNLHEQQADRFADTVTKQPATSVPTGLPLTPASPGLARKVIWKYLKDLPGDLLLIIDVDDGDFVGGCVRAIVPHAGVKLIKKTPHMQLFNLHVGFLTNPAGRFCIFFYESVTGLCEMLCFPSKKELREAWEKIKDWLKQMLEKLLKALAIAALAVALVILAYLIAQAIAAALLILVAA
jgi:hypothetical protein